MKRNCNLPPGFGPLRDPLSPLPLKYRRIPRKPSTGRRFNFWALSIQHQAVVIYAVLFAGFLLFAKLCLMFPGDTSYRVNGPPPDRGGWENVTTKDLQQFEKWANPDTDHPFR